MSCLNFNYNSNQASPIFPREIYVGILTFLTETELEKLMTVCKLFQELSWKIITQRTQLSKEDYWEQKKIVYHLTNGLYTLNLESNMGNSICWAHCNRQCVFQSKHNMFREINSKSPEVPTKEVKEQGDIDCIEASDKFLYVVGIDHEQAIDFLKVRDINKPGMPCIQDFVIEQHDKIATSKNFFFSTEGKKLRTKINIWKIHSLGITKIAQENHENLSILYAYEDLLVSYSASSGKIKLWKIGNESVLIKKEFEWPHIKCIAVRNKFLIAGTKDRTITLWDLENLNSPPSIIKDAHNDTVKDLSALHHLLLSCSKDKTIKIWNLSHPIFPCISTLKFSQPLKKIFFTQNFLFALGGRLKYTLKFDEAPEALQKTKDEFLNQKNHSTKKIEGIQLLPEKNQTRKRNRDDTIDSKIVFKRF